MCQLLLRDNVYFQMTDNFSYFYKNRNPVLESHLILYAHNESSSFRLFPR